MFFNIRSSHILLFLDFFLIHSQHLHTHTDTQTYILSLTSLYAHCSTKYLLRSQLWGRTSNSYFSLPNEATSFLLISFVQLLTLVYIHVLLSSCNAQFTMNARNADAFIAIDHFHRKPFRSKLMRCGAGRECHIRNVYVGHVAWLFRAGL